MNNKMRKIYNKITLAWNSETKRYDKVVYEDSFMHGGEIAEAMPAGCNAHPDYPNNSIAYNYDETADPHNQDMCIINADYATTGVAWHDRDSLRSLTLDASATRDVEDCPNGSNGLNGACYDCTAMINPETQEPYENGGPFDFWWDVQTEPNDDFPYSWPCLQYEWHITCELDLVATDLPPAGDLPALQCPQIVVTVGINEQLYPSDAGDSYQGSNNTQWDGWEDGSTVTIRDTHIMEIRIGDMADGTIAPISVAMNVTDIGTGGSAAEESSGAKQWIIASGINHPAILTTSTQPSGTLLEGETFNFAATVEDPDEAMGGNTNNLTLHHWIITDYNNVNLDNFHNCQTYMENMIGSYSQYTRCYGENQGAFPCGNLSQYRTQCLDDVGCTYEAYAEKEISNLLHTSGEQILPVQMPAMSDYNCTYYSRFYGMDDSVPTTDCTDSTCSSEAIVTVTQADSQTLDMSTNLDITSVSDPAGGSAIANLYPSTCYTGEGSVFYDDPELTATADGVDNIITDISVDMSTDNNHGLGDVIITQISMDDTYDSVDEIRTYSVCPQGVSMIPSDEDNNGSTTYTCGTFNVDTTATTTYTDPVSMETQFFMRCLPVVYVEPSLDGIEDGNIDWTVKVHLGNDLDECASIHMTYDYPGESLVINAAAWDTPYPADGLCTKTHVINPLVDAVGSFTVSIDSFSVSQVGWLVDGVDHEHGRDTSASMGNAATTINVSDEPEIPWMSESVTLIGIADGTAFSTSYAWAASDIQMDEDTILLMNAVGHHPTLWPPATEVWFDVEFDDTNFTVSDQSSPATLASTDDGSADGDGVYGVQFSIVPNPHFNTAFDLEGVKSEFAVTIRNTYDDPQESDFIAIDSRFQLEVLAMNDAPDIILEVNYDAPIDFGDEFSGGGLVGGN